MGSKSRYNIVLMGKSGVGKSSFGNYLFGGNAFDTGVGKPVTQNGFHPINFDLNGLPVTVFDSWGIEADKADQWISELNKELKNRDTSSEASEWFHSVFYCIQAGGHRVEPFDLKIIKRFIDDKYKVTVIFTKADTVDSEDLSNLRKVVKDEFKGNVQCIEVCSESKIIRGNKIEAFGREDVINNILLNFWNSISIRLPERCLTLMKEEVAKWNKNQYRLIEAETGYFNVGEIALKIRQEAQSYLKELCNGSILFNEIYNTINMFAVFETYLGSLGVNSQNDELLNTIELPSRSWWFYFPTNILSFFILGKGDNKARLYKLLEDVTCNMDKQIDKMLPVLKDAIDELNPRFKKEKSLQLPR